MSLALGLNVRTVISLCVVSPNRCPIPGNRARAAGRVREVRRARHQVTSRFSGHRGHADTHGRQRRIPALASNGQSERPSLGRGRWRRGSGIGPGAACSGLTGENTSPAQVSRIGRYARRMGYPDEEGASLQPDSRPDAAPRPDPPWAQATGGGRHGQAAGPPDGSAGHRNQPGYQGEPGSRIARRRAAEAARSAPGVPAGYAAGGSGGYAPGAASGYESGDTGGYGYAAGDTGGYAQAAAPGRPLTAPQAGRTGSHRRSPAPGTETGWVPEPARAPEPAPAPEPARVPEPARAPEPARVPEPARAPQPTREPEPGRGRRGRGRDAGRDTLRGREPGRAGALSAPQPPPAGDTSRENTWRRPARTAGDEIQSGFGDGGPPGQPGGPGGSLWRSGAFRTAGPGGRGPVRGYPPAPGAPDPVYPPGQFSPWNTPELRTASVAGRAGAAAAVDGAAGDGGQPGYSLLAVSDPSADATATQTWTVLDDSQQTGEWTA